MLASSEPFSATDQNSGGEEFECNRDLSKIQQMSVSLTGPPQRRKIPTSDRGYDWD